MVALRDNGYLPMIQVHDELDVSVSSEKDARAIKEIMETCVSLGVPSLVDAEFGANWGDAKQTFADEPWTPALIA
jgi:DNA polymerase I-like protein with 3'-5' exonuclease and polymerase domains